MLKLLAGPYTHLLTTGNTGMHSLLLLAELMDSPGEIGSLHCGNRWFHLQIEVEESQMKGCNVTTYMILFLGFIWHSYHSGLFFKSKES